MQNPEEPNAEQEPNAEHHVAKILVEVLILRSICGPLKRKLMAFSCHIQLSRVPPRCVMLWRSPEMNFTRRPRVAKLLCIGSPLNRSRDITYCKIYLSIADCKFIWEEILLAEPIQSIQTALWELPAVRHNKHKYKANSGTGRKRGIRNTREIKCHWHYVSIIMSVNHRLAWP